MSNDPARSDLYLPVGEDAEQFFRSSHGRTVAALSETYPLPVDKDEIKRFDLHHRLMQFVFSGKNYLGPVKEALQFGQKRRILDLGTGAGNWAIEMADEFPRADVTGIDIAPIQPEFVPPNCEFEICNLDEPFALPYPPESFDLIHARSIHIGIRNYPLLLQEIGRLLRPGGLVLLVEPDLFPAAEQELRHVSNRPESGGDNEMRPPDPTAGSSTQGAASVRGRHSPCEQEEANRHSTFPDVHAASTINTITSPQDRFPSPTCSTPTGAGGVNANVFGRDSGDASPQSAVVTGRGGPVLTVPSTEMSRRQPPTQGSHTQSVFLSPPSSSSGASSPPTNRGAAVTRNRRHLDFILNPAPQAPSPQQQASSHWEEQGDSHSLTTRAVSDADPVVGQSLVSSGPAIPPATITSAATPGWSTLWSTFRTCLQDPPHEIDVTVPSRLGQLLVATNNFENVNVKRANVPIGFWPQDPNLLTIGQLQWMDYELLIPALRFVFLSNSIPPDEVEHIIKDAQNDLYNPPVPFFAHIHIAYASKLR